MTNHCSVLFFATSLICNSNVQPATIDFELGQTESLLGQWTLTSICDSSTSFKSFYAPWLTLSLLEHWCCTAEKFKLVGVEVSKLKRRRREKRGRKGEEKEEEEEKMFTNVLLPCVISHLEFSKVWNICVICPLPVKSSSFLVRQKWIRTMHDLTELIFSFLTSARQVTSNTLGSFKMMCPDWEFEDSVMTFEHLYYPESQFCHCS